jgi:hypothetical protein
MTDAPLAESCSTAFNPKPESHPVMTTHLPSILVSLDSKRLTRFTPTYRTKGVKQSSNFLESMEN